MEHPFHCINCTAIFAKKKFLTIHLRGGCGDASDNVYELHFSQRNHVHGPRCGQNSLSNNSVYMHKCMPSQQQDPLFIQEQMDESEQKPRQRSGKCDWERMNRNIEHDQLMETMINDRDTKQWHGNNTMMEQGSISCLKRSASPPACNMAMYSSGQYGVKRQFVDFGFYSDGFDVMGSNAGVPMPQHQMCSNYSGESQSFHDIRVNHKTFMMGEQPLQQKCSMAMTPINPNTNFNSQSENNSNYININSDIYSPGNRNLMHSPIDVGGIFPNDYNGNRVNTMEFGFTDSRDNLENIVSNSGNTPQDEVIFNFDESLEHPDRDSAIQDTEHQSSSTNMWRASQKQYNTNRSFNRKNVYKNRQNRGNGRGRNMGLNNNGYFGQLSENYQQPFDPQSLLSNALVVVVSHPSIGSACLNVPRPGLGRPAPMRAQKAQKQAKAIAVPDQRTVDKPITTKMTKSEKRSLRIARKRGFILGGFKLPYCANKTQQLPQAEKESYALAFFEEKPIYIINVKNEDDEVTAAVILDDADEKGTEGDLERPSRTMLKRARKQLRLEWETLHDSKDYKNWKNWWTDFKRYGAEIHKELVKLGCLNLEHCFLAYKPNSVTLSTEQVVHGVIKRVQYALGDMPGMPYNTMKSIVTLMNTTFLKNLKSELELKAVQDTIRGVPNDLWLFKMRSMVFLWVKYNGILNNVKTKDEEKPKPEDKDAEAKTTTTNEEGIASIKWMAKQAFQNPCFHWLAMLAFSELETISEHAWADHKMEFPTI
ncbi:uncharacterized protein [Drosophila tropicalis]|uniref:uncharacterized protein n=1 Tax=Drosophila tropicalis TaxID=46794 RepID=UPI0035ABE513